MPWRLTAFVVVLLAIAAGPASPQGPSADESGFWSTKAVRLRSVNGTRKVRVAAFDNRKVALIDGVALQVALDGKVMPVTEGMGIDALAELGWAPDSSAFFITDSDGGTMGTWYVMVYLVEKARIRRISVTDDVIRRFKKHYACPEVPNIGAVGWWKNSQSLVVAAQVPPRARCAEAGQVVGYIVSIPSGAIIRELSAEKLRADWRPFLGPHLAGIAS